MNQTNVLFPMLTLVGWTALVLLLVPYRRVRAALARQVGTHDFKYGESSNVPPSVSIPNRNYMNLLEHPVLFYVVCLTLYVTHTLDTTNLVLAWLYVGLRILHSVIHLSYNKVLHRLAAFATSNLIFVALWVRLLLALAQNPA